MKNNVFSLEKEMTPIVTRWLVKSGLLVKKEVNTSEGICDLVATKINAENAKSRIHLGLTQHLSNDLQVKIWGLIAANDDFKELNQLQQVLLKVATPEDVSSEVSRLVKKKFLSPDVISGFVANKEWFPIVDSIYAIELKLTNVFEAISQASRYREFSNYSFVAFPDYVALNLNEEKLKQIHESGIGLLSVSQTSVKVLIKPIYSKANLRAQYIQRIRISEMFWKVFLKTV